MVTKVLIGAWRSKGEFEPEQKAGRNVKLIQFDNINLRLATFRGRDKLGFDFKKDSEPVKVRTVDFEEITGVDPKEFLECFEEQYMFHKVKIIGEENEYGRFDVESIAFSEDTCYELQKREEERIAALDDDD